MTRHSLDRPARTAQARRRRYSGAADDRPAVGKLVSRLEILRLASLRDKYPVGNSIRPATALMRSASWPTLSGSPHPIQGNRWNASARWVNTTTNKNAAPSSCRRDHALLSFANEMAEAPKAAQIGTPIKTRAEFI